MARYKTEVKLFVLEERTQGKGWKIISQGIKGKFNIDPPTVRAMQKWEKNLDRMALTAEFMKDIKGEMPVIETEAQVRFAQDLMPILWNAKDAGQDMELAGWKWFLHFIEGRLGSQKFERMISEYMKERGK